MVLLDYEMPVCDGRQTLEMLRSDPAFADLPVVFLTGRGDPDVVRKLPATSARTNPRRSSACRWAAPTWAPA